MDDVAAQKARRLLEPLAYRDPASFNHERFVGRVLMLSDRLLAVASADESAAQSAIHALTWAKRPVPESYRSALAGLGRPPYESAWDNDRFPGFGYALMSACLYLDYQLMDEALQRALLQRLDSGSRLPVAVAGGLARVEDFFHGALALEAAREKATNLGFSQQLTVAFLSLEDARDELDTRGGLWEKQVAEWGISIAPWEPWRDVVTTTTTHLSGLLGRYSCKITHEPQPEPEPGPGPEPEPRPRPRPRPWPWPRR